ncbi:methyltransferase type 11 [Mangrovimicrobium sediminis]|uniref:Methyltransferase type 11 n=2 Tax=Mangrovimicrobium sediminis TaxID=2562682 RepID=A0A4Z0M4E0_9GAMM|nr:methyltransferase type 11 [Haliea sp. SAOS-164]
MLRTQVTDMARRPTTHLTKSLAATALALAALAPALPCAAGTAEEAIHSPGRLQQDLERDAREQPAVIIDLLDIGPGDRVADIFGGAGYYSELLGRVVAPGGEVLLHNNQAYLQYAAAGLQRRFDGREVPNVVRHDREPADLGLGENRLDAALIIMSYHDLYFSEENWPAIDRADFMGQIVRALKPGGRFLIVDHQAAAGAGATVAHSLHRIEAATARRDIEATGLVYVGGTEVLRNPGDDHSLNVFDPAIRGRTDRFVQVYAKPEAPK